MRHALRAFPTLFRVGLAEVIAYRAEFVVWVLTTNMPLVMLAMWTTVAEGGPVQGFGKKEFVAYYLATLIVRLLTSSWVVWELTMDIRQGRMAMRLLRPLHPLWAYAAEHLAAVPMRALVVSPIVVILFVAAGGAIPLGDPVRVAIFAASLAGAWALVFLTMTIIGTLALYVDSAIGVFEVWLGVHAILSGYLVPLALFPGWVQSLARALPFRYMVGFPVETMVGTLDRTRALADLGIQWAYVAGMLFVAIAAWRAGMRRFVAFGG